MSQILTDLLMYGEKINNYIEDATDTGAGNLKFDSTTVATFTVPAGKRWLFLYGAITRDASHAMSTKIYDVSDKLIGTMDAQGAATGDSGYPTNVASSNVLASRDNIILDAGEYIKILFAGAQGAGASASCVVIEVTV